MAAMAAEAQWRQAYPTMVPQMQPGYYVPHQQPQPHAQTQPHAVHPPQPQTTGVTVGEETAVAMGAAVAEGGVGADEALLSRLRRTGRKSTANLAAPVSRRTCRQAK